MKTAVKIAIAIGISCVLAIKSESALAQSNIVPDGTLGAESSSVIQNFDGLPAEVIQGGATRGANLFHSFQEFNVSAGRGAYFFSPATIQNILARVTGNNLSEILGTLGTFGESNPNLFLINPNGIIFGQNARLDVGGSFVGSTASAVTFPNGIEFSATNPQTPPLLTINVPLGLQYGSNPGSVVVQRSELLVPDGQTLALVGGNVSLDGAILAAPGGRVELGGVAGTGTVGLNGDGSNLSLSFPQGMPLTDVSLTNGARVFVTAGGGGSIGINAFNFNMAGESALLAGIDSGLGSADSIAGNIDINATGATNLTDESVIINSVLEGARGQGGEININATGAINLTDRSRIVNSVLQGARGQGGDINITTGQLLVRDGSLVRASTFGEGDSGNLMVNASSGVQLIGTSANGLGSSLFTFAGEGSSGKAGDVTINTGSLLVRDGADVTTATFGQGDGGNLTVHASQDVQLIGTSANSGGSGLFTQTIPGSSGKGGDLTINTARLLVRDGASIGAFTNGEGDSGNLTVNASQDVQLIGTSADGRLGSSLSTSTNEGASGKPGELTINTGSLLVRDGAYVVTFTVGERDGANLTVNASEDVQLIGTSADGRSSSGLSTSAFQGSSGKAGDVTINTGSLRVRDGARVSANTFGAGNGGNLTVNASELVQLIGESAVGQVLSRLTSEAFGTGAAGNVSITTGRFIATGGAFASTATSGAGKGGNLTVNASQQVQLLGESADGLSASSLTGEAFGTGAAGSVSITTGRFIATGGAYASTYTYGAGQGGEVTVNASEFVELIGSGLFLSGIYAGTQGTGDSGNLTVNTPALLVRDGATVFTNTSGEGDAGDVMINTGTLLARDGGFVSASTFGAGNGGNLTVNASDEVQVIGSTANGVPSGLGAGAGEGSSGNAGDVTINTGSLLVRDGARISARTQSSGNGGSLTVKASDSVQLSGADSGLLVNATAGSTAGNLTVKTRQLSVRDGAQVTVSSPQGQAGNLTIQANSLRLNQGTLSAETGKSSPEGGANITLSGLDLLRMDNESLISANAFDQANGGNVTIASTFIVATPPTGSRGSDITANAQKGNGGAVNITTQGLFGIEFRPGLTPKNDITVSSEFGLNGTFQLNTPDVDPSRGLTNLPSETIDASGQIDQTCQPGGAAVRKENKFIITGRGGLPPSPNEPLHGESVITNWVTLDSDIEKENNTTPTAVTPSRSSPKQIVEAQGWIFNEKGQVVLTASSPTVTPQGQWLDSAECNTLQSTGVPR